MNYLAAKAEMAVRNCRWGEGLGGVRAEDRDFFEITIVRFFDRLNDLTKRQVKDRKRMMRVLEQNK